MNKTTEKDFKTYLKGLEESERIRVRDEFLKVTELSYPSWYAKVSGNGKFSRLELVELGRICKKSFVD